MLSIDQQEEFRNIVKPVIKFLNEFHPHVKVIIDCTSAEFLEGQCSTVTNEYVKD